jgi:DNA-binding transcriptional MerR regulator
VTGTGSLDDHDPAAGGILTARWSATWTSPADLAQRLITVDLAPMGRVYAGAMGRTGLYISELARRGGTTRKALRLYETAGILPASRRTAAGHRVYDGEALEVLSFIRCARGFGFTLAEIKEIVAIKRAGRAPCPHVRQLIRNKLEDVERVRERLRGLLNGWRPESQGRAAICPHIEATRRPTGRTKR